MLQVLLTILTLGAAPSFAETLPLRSMFGQAEDTSQNLIVTAGLHPLDSAGNRLAAGASNVADMLLVISYHERGWTTYGDRIYVCMSAPGMLGPTIDISVAFILGQETVFSGYAMNSQRVCSNSGGGPQNPGRKVFSLRKSQNEALWNKLFPLKSDGTRWYAMQLAFKGQGLHGPVFGRVNRNHVVWDSDYGKNYHVILDQTVPRYY